MEKEEIARNEQFLLLPQCFLLILTHQKQTAFENIMEKEEIARNEQFLLFPQCFLLNLTYQKQTAFENIHGGKRRNLLVTSSFSFPTMFSTHFDASTTDSF